MKLIKTKRSFFILLLFLLPNLSISGSEKPEKPYRKRIKKAKNKRSRKNRINRKKNLKSKPLTTKQKKALQQVSKAHFDVLKEIESSEKAPLTEQFKEAADTLSASVARQITQETDPEKIETLTNGYRVSLINGYVSLINGLGQIKIFHQKPKEYRQSDSFEENKASAEKAINDIEKETLKMYDSMLENLKTVPEGVDSMLHSKKVAVQEFQNLRLKLKNIKNQKELDEFIQIIEQKETNFSIKEKTGSTTIRITSS